jgi:hypothetical protein
MVPSGQPTLIPSAAPSFLPTPAPVPAIIVTPELGFHVVEGGGAPRVGVAREAIRVRLDGPPLDTVRVNITSKLGQLYFTPPTLKFDYFNYSWPQEVIIRAIDDNVMETHFHLDKALFNSTSDDNCIDAWNPNPGRCNQAVPYQGIWASVEVNITDNDKAGITMSQSLVNVTIDNYGNNMYSRSYGIRLTSEPVSDVSIDISGFGEFTALSSSSLTFTYLTWNTTQDVVLTATAATSQRPACSAGRRYCAALRSRLEVLHHNVTSQDPYYDGMNVSQVLVSISTSYDSVPAPTLTSARFTDALNGLTLTFDSDTNFGEQTGSFDCSNVLNTSYSTMKAQDTNLFGISEATCRFMSRSVIDLTFASNPTIVSVDMRAKNACTIRPLHI